jgi:hypothetical protein
MKYTVFVVAIPMATSLFFTNAFAMKTTCSNEKMSIFDRMEQKVDHLFQEGARLPVSLSRQNGNIEIRTKFEGQIMTTFAEAKLVKQRPSEFKDFFTNFKRDFPKTNPMARSVVHLEHGEAREAVKSILKFPFPLSARIMIHWKYLKLDRKPDEHILIISEEENEELVAKHLTNDEKEKYVLARTFLCAYVVKPVFKNGELIGSSIQYAFSGDTGGVIPQWVQRAVGPTTTLDSLTGLMKFVEEGQHNK